MNLCQFLQTREISEIGTVIDGLYSKVLEPLHTKAGQAEDVLNPTFPHLSSEKIERIWAQLSDMLGADFVQRDDTGRITAALDPEISAPDPFDLYRQKLQNPSSGLLADVHGDLRG